MHIQAEVEHLEVGKNQVLEREIDLDLVVVCSG